MKSEKVFCKTIFIKIKPKRRFSERKSGFRCLDCHNSHNGEVQSDYIHCSRKKTIAFLILCYEK